MARKNVTNKWLEESAALFCEHGAELSDPRLKELIDGKINELWGWNLHFISLCQTPIEKYLAVFLLDLSQQWQSVYNLNDLRVLPQQEVELERHKYRVDFLIEVTPPNDDDTKYIVVECDGHAYHERTKEQAQRDKERDRRFTRAGYTVLRFTGRELYRDPRKCYQEITKMVRSIADQYIPSINIFEEES